MNAHLLTEIISMSGRDESVRARLLNEGRAYDTYADEMQVVHRDNASRLDQLVAQHGWPTVKLVGLDGCRAAWRIAQHANCTPDLQRKFLRLLTEAAEAGEVPRPQVAFLTDRIRANEQRPQLYGTVLDWNESGALTCDIEDPAGLDARRVKMGLPPVAEDDLAGHRRRVEDEGGKPPRDFAEARRERLEWARRVGWIDAAG